MTGSQRRDLRGQKNETEAMLRMLFYPQESRLLLNYFNLYVRAAMYAEQIVG